MFKSSWSFNNLFLFFNLIISNDSKAFNLAPLVNIFHLLAYFGKPSETICKHLRFKNFKISFKTCNSLGLHIKNKKRKPVKLQKSGVYEKKCEACDKVYIGRTGRSFEARMSDYERSFIYNDGKSNYSKHILNENHIFDDDFNIFN